MRFVGLLCAAMLVSACMQDLGAAGDVLARDAAKGVVNNVVQTRFPGVNAAPYTDCIIDNATGSEIVTIAEAAVLGVTSNTTNLVVEIAGRPDTVRCALNNSLGLGGLGL